MLKRILLLLADTASSLTAREYAFKLAKQSASEVVGLAGIDLSPIDVRMPGGLGVAAFKEQLEEELRLQAEEVRQRLRAEFEQQVRDKGIPSTWLSFPEEPSETLLRATETCDLLISGHDSAFRGDLFERRSEMASKLLTTSPRPVVICPEDIPGSDDIVVAYDGSMPAMRAIQIFVLLGLGIGGRIQVVSIDDEHDVAARQADGAATYLRSHGLDVTVDPIVTRIHPSEVLRSEVSQRKIGTMVMGAYGARGFREMLFGSTTNTIVENPPCAVFLYH